MQSTDALRWAGVRLVVAPLMLALAGPALAQAETAPTGGTLLQQVPPPVVAPKPILALPQPAAVPALVPGPVDEPRIAVRTLLITGASVFGQPELLDAAGFQPPAGNAPLALTLTDLRRMAGRITEFYRNAGYFLAQAYVPAQDSRDGRITIAVLEGQFGQIELRNSAGVSDALARRLLSALHSGDAVAVSSLQTALLLLSDLPGVKAGSTLKPGAEVGRSDLVVDLKPGARWAAALDADNAGNRYTGANRMGATLQLNNTLGQGDQATLRLMSSARGLDYGRLDLHAQAGRVKLGVAGTAMAYVLGDTFASLSARGRTRIATAYAAAPLLRSRSANLYAQISLDAKRFHDQSNAVATDKQAHVLTLNLNGDRRDDWLGGGSNSGSVSLASGRNNILSAAARTADAPAGTTGAYQKLSLHLSRVQSLSDSVWLYTAVDAQWASKNLDNAEKMKLGGATGVRAYPEGEASGDEGWLVNAELRWAAPRLAWLPGQIQLMGFVDSGNVALAKRPWTAAANRRSLSGAGLGLQWFSGSGTELKVQWAHKLGQAAATSAPDARQRLWLQATHTF